MKRALLTAAAVGLLIFTPTLHADVEAVNKYLDDATLLVSQGPSSFDDASAKLELAESSMDDVPEGQKAALKAKIDALKTQIAGAANEQQKKIVQGKIERYMHEAEESIGNLVTWKGAAANLSEYLDDPKTATLLGNDEVAKYKKQFATFQKLNGGKALKANLEQASGQVDELEKSWAENKKKIADEPNESANTLTDAGRDLEGIERFFTDLPADNADVQALRARVDKVKSEVATAGSSAGAADQLTSINRFLDTYSRDFADMDKEAGDQTWADYTKSNREMKTKSTEEYVHRVGEYVKGLDDEEGYKASKDAPAVKAKVDELKKKVEAGRAKLKSQSEKLVSGLEAEKVNENNKNAADMLKTQIRNALGEEAPETVAFNTRIDKLVTDFENAGAAADAAKVEAYKKMTDAAAKAWPDMMAKFDVATGFDPNNYKDFKGKFIKITTDNLMGYHFKPGDFPFATTLNGHPVAAKYDPTIAAAISEVETKIGRGLGDSDDDGKWVIIAKVEGSTGTLYQKQEVTGDITDHGGGSVGSWSGTQVTPVESPIVTIVAAHCGPLAAAQGQGTVKEDGSVGKSAPPPAGSALAQGTAGSHGRFSFAGIIMGLFTIAVGAICLMKAKFAPLATSAGAAQFTDKVGGQNLQYIGVAGIVLGVLGILMNVIHLLSAPLGAFIGLLASAAMIVAGGVAAREFFDERKILPPNVGPLLTQFAIPAGLACAVLGLLTVIVSL